MPPLYIAIHTGIFDGADGQETRRRQNQVDTKINRRLFDERRRKIRPRPTRNVCTPPAPMGGLAKPNTQTAVVSN